MKYFFILFLLGSITGCSSLWWAGTSQYEISPLVDVSNKIVGCCTLKVISGKEYAAITAKFVKTGDNYEITLNEKQVLAFKGQEISASAATDVASSVAAATVNAAATAAKLIK